MKRPRAPSPRALAAALEDLRHLPRVLKALKVLNAEQEKLRQQVSAQMGLFDAVPPAPPAEPMAGRLIGAPSTPRLVAFHPAPSAAGNGNLETMATDSLTTSADPPPSEAQRERMARQKAFVAQQRAALTAQTGGEA